MRGSKGHPGRSRLWFAALALAVTALIAAGCGGDDDDSGDSGDPMTVGLSLPLTGEFSQPGKAAQQGYQVWAEAVNKEGGLLGRQVELEIKDDGSDQNTVVADYNGGAPEIFERDFQYGPFFTQQATADHQGDLFAEWVLALPANERPKTVAYAVLDDPFTVPVVDALRATFDDAGIRGA